MGNSEELLRNKIYKLKNGVYKYNLNIDGYLDIVTLNVSIKISDYDIYVDILIYLFIYFYRLYIENIDVNSIFVSSE